jgi:hypothetical protein
LTRLEAIVEQAGKRGETRAGIDPKAVAVLIVAALEGALAISRIQRNDDALRRVQAHLNSFIDNEVAAT